MTRRTSGCRPTEPERRGRRRQGAAAGLPVRAGRALAGGGPALDRQPVDAHQEWYPDPPLVLFISNNEHGKLAWTKAEQSQRYLDQYGRGRPDDFKRKVVADGWIERYGALMAGMRAGLASPAWKKNARFIGYEAFGPPHFGRWGGWKEYSSVRTRPASTGRRWSGTAARLRTTSTTGSPSPTTRSGARRSSR